MKKILSLLLCAALIFAACVPVFAADEPEIDPDVILEDDLDEPEISDEPEVEAEGVEPVVIVPGFAETTIYRYYEDGGRRRYYDPVVDSASEDIPGLVGALLKAFFLFSYGDIEDLLRKFGDVAGETSGMNPDGTSISDTRPGFSTAAQSSYSALQASGEWWGVDTGARFAPEIADQIGGDNVFVFGYDWRLGAPTLAAQLETFIADALEMTGGSKVNIYCNSYGCGIVAQYLYTADRSDSVARVVFNSPAWTGTAACADLFAESADDVDINVRTAMRTFMRLLDIDLDIEFVGSLIPKRIVKRLFGLAAQEILPKYYAGCPSVWCLCATEDYEELKARVLDPEANAAVIAEADEAQYGYMTHIPELLDSCKESGISTAIVMNNDTELMTGHDVNGDGIVSFVNGAGGDVRPVGKPFVDGRAGKHIAPSNDVDLTNGYLPERTWVITGQTHGQSFRDAASHDLVLKLLLTDELETVDSDPAFPQFRMTHNPGADLSIDIDGVGSVIDHDKDTVEAVIVNNSDSRVTITSVSISGVDYRIGLAIGRLEPGESKTVKLSKTVMTAPGRYGKITVKYFKSAWMILPKTHTAYVKVL